VARRLDPEERALWAKVIATVRPLHQARPEPVAPAEPPPAPKREPKLKGRVAPLRAEAAKPVPPKPHEAATLDGGWDRRLSRGLIQPDLSVDLHGHTLNAAYHLLDARLEQAIAAGARVLLLITGKPPRPESERPHARGAIRAAVGDWLASSRHADRIAAVRTAHPRHGGSGALYIVLRRPRAAPPRKS
jgi:DNA-nicking Smr family endonuclease